MQSGPEPHLYIICTDECKLGACLLVNITSARDGCDQTCILDVGDHPFIKHPSCIFYAKAIIRKCDQIKGALAAGAIEAAEDVAEDVLDRILAGFTISEDTPPQIIKYLTQS